MICQTETIANEERPIGYIMFQPLASPIAEGWKVADGRSVPLRGHEKLLRALGTSSRVGSPPDFEVRLPNCQMYCESTKLIPVIKVK
jgi:hypothetical protein